MGISLAVSHSSLHQVQHNVLWGQADNLMMIPTDCDQRDERLGPRNQRDATEVE